MTVADAEDPVSRVMELADVIARLRLSKIDAPSEPDPEAIRILFLDYFASNQGQDSGKGDEKERIGSVLESLVNEAARKRVLASENQPYFGCHRTSDSKPPHPPENPSLSS